MAGFLIDAELNLPKASPSFRVDQSSATKRGIFTSQSDLDIPDKFNGGAAFKADPVDFLEGVVMRMQVNEKLRLGRM